MKISPDSFRASFVQKAQQHLQPKVRPTALAADGAHLSAPVHRMAFEQALLAVSLAAQTSGSFSLAGLAQEVGRSLVTPEQEARHAASVQDLFSQRFVESDVSLKETWNQLQAATGSRFPAPRQVNSPLVYAQADSQNLLIGQDALRSDLSDPDVLTFTLAHEEAHRQHRDSAGVKGLEALLEACQDEPELAKLASQAMREGRFQNELLADAYAADVSARLGCAPLPILKFLLTLPEDQEHPPGRLRALVAREAMANAGVKLSEQEWARISVSDPRNNPKFADLGKFHADPASWSPLHLDLMEELKLRRQDYLQGQSAGTLVVLDHFFAPQQTEITHGVHVAASARSAGFTGPLLEVDGTYAMQKHLDQQLNEMSRQEERFWSAQDGAEIRQALQEWVVLKHSYAFERTAGHFDQLTRSGLKNSAVNLSMGNNVAGDVQRLLERTLDPSPEKGGKALFQLLRAFSSNLQNFISDNPQVVAKERAHVVGQLAQFLSQARQDPRFLEAQRTYQEAFLNLEAGHNSVVLAAGNEGEVLDFVQQWCSGVKPELPENFEHNDYRHPALTMVGAIQNGQRAPYTSREPEIDFWADGQQGEEKGTSFAAPRVAARLAEIHAKHPNFTSQQAEDFLRAERAYSG